METVGPLSILVEWALSVHAFHRNRVPVTKKVVAAALCNSGYSYRDVSRMLGGMSYIAARDSYFSLLTSLPREERKFRRAVAVDGSDVNINGSSYHLWLARDYESGSILTFQASPDASAEDGNRFLASVASQCENKPNLKLGEGPNHPRGLVNFDLYFQPLQSVSIMTKIGHLILGVNQ
jgi:putative transposase